MQGSTRESTFRFLTPPGLAGIQVARLAGPGVEGFIERSVRFLANSVQGQASGLAAFADRELRYAQIHDNGDIIDEVLLNLRRDADSNADANSGYSLDISGHGAPAVAAKLKAMLAAQGFVEEDIRLASPGRPSPLEAKFPGLAKEAQDGLAAAHSVHQILFFSAALEGRFGRELETLIGILRGDGKPHQIHFAHQSVDSYLSRLDFGLAHTQPPRVVLVGAPNVGKSTLFNVLLGAERAIVSAEVGTTRDAIHASISLQSYPFQLTDTAGIHLEGDALENLGIARSRALLESADIVVFVADATRDDAESAWEDFQSDAWGQGSPQGRARIVRVLNKADCLNENRRRELKAANPGWLVVSATEGLVQGEIQALIEALVFRSAFSLPGAREFACPFTSRQGDLIRRAQAALERNDLVASAEALEAILLGTAELGDSSQP